MEKVLLKKLRGLVKEHGLLHVASVLKEKDTQSLRRWLSEGKLPAYKINLINTFLTRGENVRTK